MVLNGTLERIKVHGKSLEGNLMKEPPAPEVSIYLPPSYAKEPNRRYPVVYLLHGYTNSDLGYFGPTGRQLHLIAERVFGAGSAREMILVMPNCMNAYGGCMYSNSVTAGDWEGYVADDLVGYMDSHYRTLASRASRGLAGHSMGGYGTLRIAMKRPDVFSAIYALSSCCLNEGTVRPSRDGAPSAAESIKSIEEARLFDALDRFGRGWRAVARRPHGPLVQAARAERVDGAEDVRSLHRDSQRAVAAHRMAGQAPAGARGQRAVMAVHVAHEIVGDVAFPVTGGDRVGVHAPAVGVHAVRHHQDHFPRRTGAEHALGDQVQLAAGRAEVAEVRVGVAVEQVDDRVATVRLFRVARWQVDGNLGRRGFLHQVAFRGTCRAP